MIDVDKLYFKWLLDRLDADSVQLERACFLLHGIPFNRRVGNDKNRASYGVNLRSWFFEEFAEAEIDPHVSNDLMARECSWFEMLSAFAESLDYLYEGGVPERLEEMLRNMGLGDVLDISEEMVERGIYDHIDERRVIEAVERVTHNQFDSDGHGGLFPLTKNDHPDQRGVEIWEQQAAYFRERLEGVMWTSSS